MYYYPSTGSAVTINSNLSTFLIIAIIVSIAVAIVVYLTFMGKNNEGKLSKNLTKLYDFLHFKNFYIVDFLKICYIFATVFLTIISFSIISYNFFSFLLILVVGNIMIRIGFEAVMVVYRIYENTNEMVNKKKKEKE